MTEREALKLALEALEQMTKPRPSFEAHKNAITAIKEALARQDVRDEIDRGAKTLRETYLAQPEQEPKVWGLPNANGDILDVISPEEHERLEGGYTVALYTKTPQRKPLTVEKLREHWQVAKVLDMTDAEIDFADYVLIARDVEALYGIKGEPC